MLKLYGLGMEHKALGTCAIYVVTNNRSIQALGMRCMDTQLVRATRNGIEAYARAAINIPLYIIYRMCRTTILGNHLAGAVFIIKFQGQTYLTMRNIHNTLKQCDIALLYGTRDKLLL